MKATELMCDDIVLHHGNTYKVFGVMGEANVVDLFPVQLRNAEWMMPAPLTCFATEIAPMPLTDEILEMNGFRRGRYAGGYYHPLFGFRVLPIKENRDSYFEMLEMFSDVFYHCHYVHELQHTLRTYGLSELANNFKV